jgi:3-oxoacyl-[acyl-carrier protein] reductase
MTDKSMAKTAIVTGSATGLGAACALQLAEVGWNVVVNYSRSRKEAEETYEKVRAKGAEVLLVQADVGQDNDCRRLAAQAVSKWGRIDGLINNAATTKFQKDHDLEDVAPEDFDRIMRINVAGPYMMTRAVWPTMKRQWDELGERGSIVNISSTAGATGSGSSIPYIASKGALNTLTLTLARWLSPAVRVNTVCPGFIQSRWLLNGLGEVEYEKLKAQMEQITPLQQTATPEQVAEAVLFFLTSGSNITGEILLVDAGRHLTMLPLKGR